MKQRGFFDENDRLKELSLLGDPLEKTSIWLLIGNHSGIALTKYSKRSKGTWWKTSL